MFFTYPQISKFIFHVSDYSLLLKQLQEATLDLAQLDSKLGTKANHLRQAWIYMNLFL